MNAGEYLQEIRNAVITVKCEQIALRELDKLLQASAINYSGDRIQSSPRKDSLERQAIKDLEKRERIKRTIEDNITFLHERIEQAVGYISKIESPSQREVLMLRYIEQKSWGDIMIIRGCDDPSGQHQLHNRALESLQKIIDTYSIPTP